MLGANQILFAIVPGTDAKGLEAFDVQFLLG